jgi:hypothetical protein
MSILLKIDSSTGGVPGNGQTTDNFEIFYPSGIPIDNVNEWEIALVKANFVNSIFNVSAKMGNNTIAYTVTTLFTPVTYSISFSDGTYSLSDINSLVVSYQTARGHLISGNPYFTITGSLNTLKTDIFIEDYSATTISGISVDVQNMRTILGFTTTPVNSIGDNFSQNVANLSNGIVSLDIHCSIIKDSFDSYKSGDILYNVPVTSNPGYLQVVSPYELIYLPLNVSDRIVRIQMRITDQNQNSINFNGENVSYLLHLRKKRAPVSLL